MPTLTPDKRVTLHSTPDPDFDLRDFLSEGIAATLTWQERALCPETDPEVFFPEKGGGTFAIDQARATCMVCPVRIDCLNHAIDNAIAYGIWGGMTYRERLQHQAGKTVDLRSRQQKARDGAAKRRARASAARAAAAASAA